MDRTIFENWSTVYFAEGRCRRLRRFWTETDGEPNQGLFRRYGPCAGYDRHSVSYAAD